MYTCLWYVKCIWYVNYDVTVALVNYVNFMHTYHSALLHSVTCLFN